MVKRIFSLFLAAFMLFATVSMTACSNSDTEVEANVIRVCNCEDYIDEDLLDEFTEETGIEVIYSTYGTNENLYNELVINPNSYDLVVPSEYMIEKLAMEGRIQKLDFSHLTDYQNNVSPYIQERLNNLEFVVEAGEYEGQKAALSEYMVGYMWGTMGWVYNTEKVNAEDVATWGGVFENQSLNKRITIKDAVRDSYIVGLAMVYKDDLINATTNAEISEILNRTEKENIQAVKEKLVSLKPMLYGFEVDSGKNDIVLGNIDAYVAWSGDAAYAIDVAAGEVEDEDGTVLEGDSVRQLSYSIPEEGSNIWFDGFVMPVGSDNHAAVYKFLEFISRPENVYRNMDYTGYTGIVAKGDFTLEDNNGEEYQTNLFNEIVLGWFDEGLNEGEEGSVTVDLSYFFRSEGDEEEYKVTVSEDGYGRLIAQYPTAEIVDRCAIMNNFKTEKLMDINEMWEEVKGGTFSTWVIILVVVLVVLLAAAIVVYRNKDKIKWFDRPQKEKPRRKNCKVIKIEEI